MQGRQKILAGIRAEPARKQASRRTHETPARSPTFRLTAGLTAGCDAPSPSTSTAISPPLPPPCDDHHPTQLTPLDPSSTLEAFLALSGGIQCSTRPYPLTPFTKRSLKYVHEKCTKRQRPGQRRTPAACAVPSKHCRLHTPQILRLLHTESTH